jgi:hypothetical protein
MIRLPESPLSFTSRLLRCASCREQFAVAEAFVQDNHHKPQQRGRNGGQIGAVWLKTHLQSWREPSRNNLDRIIFPEHIVADHLSKDVTEALPLFDTAVACPRCSADNRNWLQLQTKPDARRPLLGISYDRFPLAIGGMIICFALSLAAFVLVFKPDPDFIIRRAMILLLAVALTGYFTTSFVTSRWLAQREYRYKRPFMPQASGWQRLPPALRAGLPVLPISVMVVPLLLFIILPLSLNILGLVAASPTERPTVIRSGLETAQTALESVAPQMNHDKEINSQLTAVLEILSALQVNPIAESGERVPAVSVSRLGPDLDRDFLRTWLWFVGGAWVISYVFALLAVSSYVGRVDNVLPSLIFTSVARMTPVAIREARIALRADHTITAQVQWTHVERLPDGGIRLSGIHRQRMAADENGRTHPAGVRAQQYTVQTDLWCHIVQVEVRDVNVPPAMQAPAETAAYQRQPGSLYAAA